jgi:sulfate adenylyltransferase
MSAPASAQLQCVVAEVQAQRLDQQLLGPGLHLAGHPRADLSPVQREAADTLAGKVGRGFSVTLLDGDVVRTHLSKELGFSRADRDTNIERIAFVAAEVVKHGGIVISAAIAPYEAARAAARERIEANGRFVLVHLSTPLAVCETRDAKGLYAKARRGEIEMFTGVTDAYEQPAKAELTIDASITSTDDAVATLLTAITKEEV